MVIKNFVNCVKRGVKSGFNKVMDSRPVRCCVGVALGLFASNRHQALLCHCWCRGHRRCHLCLREDEQRGAGCQEVDYDDHRCMCVPDCCSSGSASVLRY